MAPFGQFLTWEQWDSNPLDSQVCKNALMSCQAFNHSAMNYHAEDLYQEPHRVTGNVGSVTEVYMHSPRCPLPDFVPPPGAVIDVEDHQLRKAIESMKAIGAGSWEMPCQKECTFVVDETRMPAELRSYWDLVLRDVVNDFRRRGWGLVDGTGAGTTPHIRISFENLDHLGRGVIGLAELPSGSCNDSLFCKMHPGYRPGDTDQNRQLLQHELGHNGGLLHTAGGVMNSSLSDGWVGFVDTDPSTPRLNRFFGGEPVDPEPPAPPPVDDVRVEGIQTVTVNGEPIGRFISTKFVPV